MRYESTLLERSFNLSAIVLFGLLAAGILGLWRERRALSMAGVSSDDGKGETVGDGH